MLGSNYDLAIKLYFSKLEIKHLHLAVALFEIIMADDNA